MPIGSWPTMSPGSMNGASGSYRCRSEPHSPLEVTLMMMSVGSSMRGSGTSVTCMSWTPCQVTAFTKRLLRCEREADRPLTRPAAPSSVAVEPPLDRVAGELHAVVHLELAQRVLHVVLDGPVGDHEPVGDLAVREPLGDHPEHLGLPLGQPGLAVVVRRRLGHPLEL